MHLATSQATTVEATTGPLLGGHVEQPLLGQRLDHPVRLDPGALVQHRVVLRRLRSGVMSTTQAWFLARLDRPASCFRLGSEVVAGASYRVSGPLGGAPW